MEKRLDYNIQYINCVDKEWVAKQFELYDLYVKEHLDASKFLNSFDGTSYNENGVPEYNIVNLGDFSVNNVPWRLCSSDAVSNMI